MVLAEFSIFPMDKGESVSAYVARVLDIVDKSGLAYRLGPLGTCVEGEWDEVMQVIRQCHQELERDCGRIYCNIKTDYRKGRSGRLEGKMRSVQEKLGRTLKT